MSKTVIRLIATVLVFIYFAIVITIFFIRTNQAIFVLEQPWIQIADDLFFVLTQPWSSIVVIFSNLIIHIADDGIKFMNQTMFIGSIINSLNALAIIWKFKNKTSKIETNS